MSMWSVEEQGSLSSDWKTETEVLLREQSEQYMIEFVNRKDIDSDRWDEVIAHSPAETLYPYSWYLDAVSANWSALIMNDYQYIMPLVWKKKYGIKFLYQPFYCQQLGVFSRKYVDPATVAQFVSRLTKSYRFGTLSLNTLNLIGDHKRLEVYDRTNYVLPLQREYDTLYASFSTNVKRNLKRARDRTGEVENEISPDELILFKKENDVIKRPEEAYLRLKDLIGSVIKNSRGIAYGLRDGDRLSAAAFFGFSRTRAIYLLSSSSEQGKENRAMFKIVNDFIRSYATFDLVLDFEGSNIPSVARFFSGFGARPEIYQGISFTRLPLLISKLRDHGR